MKKLLTIPGVILFVFINTFGCCGGPPPPHKNAKVYRTCLCDAQKAEADNMTLKAEAKAKECAEMKKEHIELYSYGNKEDDEEHASPDLKVYTEALSEPLNCE